MRDLWYNFDVKKKVKEQKTPARGVFTPSETEAGRLRFKAQKGVSRSAERDLRRCLKKPQVFEKT
jgi:hypothetical protein